MRVRQAPWRMLEFDQGSLDVPSPSMSYVRDGSYQGHKAIYGESFSYMLPSGVTTLDPLGAISQSVEPDCKPAESF